MRCIIVLLALVFVAFASGVTTDGDFCGRSSDETVTDGFLDELDYIDLELLGGSPRCVGVGFDGANFWVTDAQDAGGPLWLHIIDGSTHTLITTVDQYETEGWGLRDLCCDGSYIFGSQDNEVDYYDIGTYAYVGSYTCDAVSPNRAQAWDGTNFYTGSQTTDIYKVTWDGVSGSTATYTTWSSAVGNAKTYGAAWDYTNNCLWVSTNAGDNMLYQIDSNGDLIAAHFYSNEYAGGCTMGSYSGSFENQLWTLEQGTPDALRCYETAPLALESNSWGGIKTLF
ncbi:MAG: hypothetical protein K8S24_05295 [Candidatus Aegiribacteria sp.]|nr:hypothetical protein [Candidatus Aegiribacteria sp.]